MTLRLSQTEVEGNSIQNHQNSKALQAEEILENNSQILVHEMPLVLDKFTQKGNIEFQQNSGFKITQNEQINLKSNPKNSLNEKNETSSEKEKRDRNSKNIKHKNNDSTSTEITINKGVVKKNSSLQTKGSDFDKSNKSIQTVSNYAKKSENDVFMIKNEICQNDARIGKVKSKITENVRSPKYKFHFCKQKNNNEITEFFVRETKTNAFYRFFNELVFGRKNYNRVQICKNKSCAYKCH